MVEIMECLIYSLSMWKPKISEIILIAKHKSENWIQVFLSLANKQHSSWYNT